MRDPDCIAFLQWALPQLGMRWPGFRRVRHQVCKRIARRMAAIDLPDVTAYRDYLAARPDEWIQIDRLCAITISRFCRDPPVFAFLARAVLPVLAHSAQVAGRREVRAWSAGCASGEEAYTLILLWHFAIDAPLPLRVLGTDVVDTVLARARDACYASSAMKLIPSTWRTTAFSRTGNSYCLRDDYRSRAAFRHEDLRETLPKEDFDIIFCRNLAFTYFDESVQHRTLGRLLTCLQPGGALVIGRRESLPLPAPGLAPWSAALGIYRKEAAKSHV